MYQLVADYVTKNNTTFEAVAKKVGISRVNLHQKLTGKREFRLTEAFKLADMLGTSVDSLRQYL